MRYTSGGVSWRAQRVWMAAVEVSLILFNIISIVTCKVNGFWVKDSSKLSRYLPLRPILTNAWQCVLPCQRSWVRTFSWITFLLWIIFSSTLGSCFPTTKQKVAAKTYLKYQVEEPKVAKKLHCSRSTLVAIHFTDIQFAGRLYLPKGCIYLQPSKYNYFGAVNPIENCLVQFKWN